MLFKSKAPVRLLDIPEEQLLSFVKEYEALPLEGALLWAAKRYAGRIKELCQGDDINWLEMEELLRGMETAWSFFERVQSGRGYYARYAAQRVQEFEKTENGLFCLCQHFAVWYEQMKNRKQVDFGAPCVSCRKLEECAKKNFPWDDFIFPILRSQGLRIQMGSSD